MPTKTSKAEQARQEREEAQVRLRALFPAGATVHTLFRDRARSGGAGTVSVFAVIDGAVEEVSHLVARATGMRLDPRRPGIRVTGYGMDLSFHLVYALSRALYADGWTCVGDACMSSEHVNPPRPGRDGFMRHTDGGYALRHRHM